MLLLQADISYCTSAAASAGELIAGRSSGDSRVSLRPSSIAALICAGLGFAESVLVLQFLEWRTVQPAQPAEFVEQSLPNRDRAFTLYTHAQQDGDQFGIAQSLWPQRCQPLARAVRFVQVHDAIDEFEFGIQPWNILGRCIRIFYSEFCTVLFSMS